MTTTERSLPGSTQTRNLRVLVVAGACVAVAVLVTALVGWLVGGSAAALGALVGGGAALGFFLLGSLTVTAAARVAPQASMLVALLTFVLQVAAVAWVFSAISRSGMLGDELSEGWLATGVVVAAVAWMVAQLYGATRARIPAYDLDLPTPAGDRSHGREVGAP